MQKAVGNAEFTIEAVHFEHGIRGKAGRDDAEWCRHFCELRKIPFRQINLKMERTASNIEATARQLRLNEWKKIIKSESEAVALGQHADDRIENLFLRMMRGSNATGLTSLRSSQKIGNITFLRPLIDVRRSDIEKFLFDAGITDWRTDHTNNDSIYRRNIIRNKLLPMLRNEFPESDRAIIKSISTLETDALFLEESAFNAYNEIIKEESPDSKKSIHISSFSRMHPALRPRVLRLWLSDIFSADIIPAYDFIKRFNDAISGCTDKRILVPFNGAFSILIEKTLISVERTAETERVPCTVEWNLKQSPMVKWRNFTFSAVETVNIDRGNLVDRKCNSVYFDAPSMPEKVIIRDRRKGDKMVPFGKNSSVKLKKILQNSELTQKEKRETPVVTTPDGTIIWIPGVRRANFADISKSGNSASQNNSSCGRKVFFLCFM
jgi:tRNA(Ile)-lysidine synthase